MADCLPLPVVCIQCGPGVNNACHFKIVGMSSSHRLILLQLASKLIRNSRTNDRIRNRSPAGNHLLATLNLFLLLRDRDRQKVSCLVILLMAHNDTASPPTRNSYDMLMRAILKDYWRIRQIHQLPYQIASPFDLVCGPVYWFTKIDTIRWGSARSADRRAKKKHFAFLVLTFKDTASFIFLVKCRQTLKAPDEYIGTRAASAEWKRHVDRFLVSGYIEILNQGGLNETLAVKS